MLLCCQPGSRYHQLVCCPLASSPSSSHQDRLPSPKCHSPVLPSASFKVPEPITTQSKMAASFSIQPSVTLNKEDLAQRVTSYGSIINPMFAPILDKLALKHQRDELITELVRIICEALHWSKWQSPTHALEHGISNSCIGTWYLATLGSLQLISKAMTTLLDGQHLLGLDRKEFVEEKLWMRDQ